jgi:hypothetical protein
MIGQSDFIIFPSHVQRFSQDSDPKKILRDKEFSRIKGVVVRKTVI